MKGKSGVYDALEKAGKTEDLFRSPAGAAGLKGAWEKLLTPKARQTFWGICDHLLASTGGARLRSVLVCSASAGEGATTIGAGLAIAAAEKWAGPVLLVDGNYHSPRVLEAFGVAEDGGLADLLSGGKDVASLTRQTTISNLSVMGSGVISGDHIRALEPPKFRGLLENWSSRYQFIVVDGPAINAFPESVLYSSQVDCVLLVVRAGVSRRPVVAKALSKLSAGGGQKVEVVLNRRTFPIPQTVYKRL